MAKLIEILMVEDNPSDVRLTQEFFKSYKLLNRISFVNNGQEALAVLHHQGLDGQMIQPDMILFSLRQLMIDGETILAEIQQDTALIHIPIVVLTAFVGEEKVLDVANSLYTTFIPKPLDLLKMHAILTSIEGFWFSIVREKPATQS